MKLLFGYFQLLIYVLVIACGALQGDLEAWRSCLPVQRLPIWNVYHHRTYDAAFGDETSFGFDSYWEIVAARDLIWSCSSSIYRVVKSELCQFRDLYVIPYTDKIKDHSAWGKGLHVISDFVWRETTFALRFNKIVRNQCETTNKSSVFLPQALWSFLLSVQGYHTRHDYTLTAAIVRSGLSQKLRGKHRSNSGGNTAKERRSLPKSRKFQ
jgi:hypothetical protein